MTRWVALCLLVPALAWVPVIFGRSVGPGFIEAVIQRLKRKPAIRGVNYTQVDHDFCKAP